MKISGAGMWDNPNWKKPFNNEIETFLNKHVIRNDITNIVKYSTSVHFLSKLFDLLYINKKIRESADLHYKVPTQRTQNDGWWEDIC